MSGRASLIVVVGFAFIFGYLNLNMSRLSTSGIENMVGYGVITSSRNIANAGANVGMSMVFTATRPPTGTLVTQSFTKSPFAGCSYTVTNDSLSSSTADTTFYRLLSISNCPTIFKTLSGTQLILSDTVMVEYNKEQRLPFSYWGWLTNTENGVYFITGDSIFGKAHSNGNFYINGTPYFDQHITTSGTFTPPISTKKNPTSNTAFFNNGYETNIGKVDFPSDLSDLKNHATNKTTTQTSELYVELKGGLSGTDNDGYAIIRTGSFTGTKVDSIKMSGTTDNVIYTTKNVHLKGIDDGRISIASGQDVIIEDNVKYEVSPKTNINTKDMLGIVANNNVRIADNGTIGPPGIEIDASIFCLTGSFTADNWHDRGKEGYLNVVGSITQNIRGPVGNFNSSTGKIDNGFLKNYKFDDRFNDPYQSPPSFPGSGFKGAKVTEWWESPGSIISYF